MASHRPLRLNEQFKREISYLLAREVRDPRVEGVFVTEVRVTPDLWLARVYFRTLGEGHSPEEALAGLQAAAPFMRRQLGRRMRLRRIPEFRFIHDTTLDSASRIEAVLREVLPADGSVPRGGKVGSPDEPAEGGSVGKGE